MTGKPTFILSSSLMLALAGCAAMNDGGVAPAASRASGTVASGTLRLANGTDVGTVRVTEASNGALSVQVMVAGYPTPGNFGMHVHAVGRCEGPGFTTAGPHWNPTSRQHGRDNPMGSHHGDLPNLLVPASGATDETYPLTGMARGEGGLLDADGAAFIIHATTDDNRTDPTGNSGARVACAVLTPAG
jgi:superoxide dismutase, Cu-Zn family